MEDTARVPDIQPIIPAETTSNVPTEMLRDSSQHKNAKGKGKKIWLFLLIVVLAAIGLGASYILSQPEPAAKTNQVQKKNTQTLAKKVGVVDTYQDYCYDNEKSVPCPNEISAFFGQDAQYTGLQPRYKIPGDGTVTDVNTGLMWSRNPGAKKSYAEAVAEAETFNLAGFEDWRLPTVKELYTLIDFRGTDPSEGATKNTLIPFIDSESFVFAYGNESDGQRIIDSQWATSTIYKSKVMGQECFFGVNFADGRIKCYPTKSGSPNGGYYVIYVRGESYGKNEFVNNGDDTIIDRATNLTWMKKDSGKTMNWEQALKYCADLNYMGHDDWRLPNAKELQGIVDYERSPDITSSPAIDSAFFVSQIENEAGQKDYGYYWTSTTHKGFPDLYGSAVYIAFGRAMGYMEEFGGWVDVHGAGAQRSDPKAGNPANYPRGRGPQGDAIRINNYARCVRDGAAFKEVEGIDPGVIMTGTGTSKFDLGEVSTNSSRLPSATPSIKPTP